MSAVERIAAIAFPLSVALLAHAYVGYPALVGVAGAKVLPRPRMQPRGVGANVMIIAVHNEEAVIAHKLDNALKLDPSDVQIVVVSDGSTDRTDAIVEQYARRTSQVRLLRVGTRGGKNHALNHALAKLRLGSEDLVVFTDANAMFAEDAVQVLRARLESGAACVVGKLVFTDAATGTARAEGLYWRYENAIKAWEGELGRLPVGNGAIFAVRAGDVGSLPEDVGNDFWLPLVLLGSGRPVVYEASAVAWEPAAQGASEEFARKVRMANRQMRGVLIAWRRLDWATRFQLVSHKVLRWFGIPLLLIGAAAALPLSRMHPVFVGAAAVLLAPFALAGLELTAGLFGGRTRLGTLAVHFVAVHWAAFRGVSEALQGKRRAIWGKASSSRGPGAITEENGSRAQPQAESRIPSAAENGRRRAEFSQQGQDGGAPRGS